MFQATNQMCIVILREQEQHLLKLTKSESIHPPFIRHVAWKTPSIEASHGIISWLFTHLLAAVPQHPN